MIIFSCFFSCTMYSIFITFFYDAVKTKIVMSKDYEAEKENDI